MRERWQTVSRLWEENKALANNLNLLSQLDYMGKLSSQLKWLRDAKETGPCGSCTPSQVDSRRRLFCIEKG